MREIIFRGKRTFDGEWVYGDLIHKKQKYYIHPHNVNGMDEVIPETVSQYMGLRDINDRKTYEGDILQHIVYKDKYRVIYDTDEYMYCLVDLKDGIEAYTFSDYCDENGKNIFLEVVGNIYDNPELLEE